MSGRKLFTRHPANPILTAEDWPYPVNVVFNPAAAKVDGDTVKVDFRLFDVAHASELLRGEYSAPRAALDRNPVGALHYRRRM